MALNDNALEIIQQMRLDIAPGASGWDNASEEGSLRQLASDAVVTLGEDPQSQTWLDAQNEAIGRITSAMAPGYQTYADQRDIEVGANPGQVNSSLIAVETYFIDTIGEEATG